MKRQFVVRPEDVDPYSPANHTETINRRLIGPETVGAQQVEVVLGVIQQHHGTVRHTHPNMEQVCYVLEGRGVAEIGDQRREIEPGDCCFCPMNTPHVFTANSETPLKLLVIYSPPYLEDRSKVTGDGIAADSAAVR